MTSVTLNATGSAAPEVAWERYAEPAMWPRWAPQITGVDATADRIAAGVTGTVRGPLGVSADFRIREVDEQARRWAWTVRRGPLTVRLQHGVRSAAQGSATWLIIDAPLPVAVAYAPLAWLAMRRLVAG